MNQAESLPTGVKEQQEEENERKQEGEEEEYRLKFVPYSSAIESPFWITYNRLKLETIRLSEDPLPLQATYSIESSSSSSSSGQLKPPPRLQCHENSLVIPPTHNFQPPTAGQDDDTICSVVSLFSSLPQNQFVVANERIHVQGVLLGYNTIEAFQTVDKNELLKKWFCKSFFPNENSESDNNNNNNNNNNITAALSMFLLLSYPDLKHHNVIYWFGFPTLLTKNNILSKPPIPLVPHFSKQQALDLALLLNDLRFQCQQQRPLTPFFVWQVSQNTCVLLQDWKHLSSETKIDSNVVFGFWDPVSSGNDPGWPMRNLIAYLTFHLGFGGTTVTILSYRPGRLRRIEDTTNHHDQFQLLRQYVEADAIHDDSLLFFVTVPQKQDYQWEQPGDAAQQSGPFGEYRVSGWEWNGRPGGKPGPRRANLRPLLDSRHLAIQAADLNLRLLKWRMMPQLNVDKLQSTRVLLLGAGTLGCHVARTCLAWGIRKITFVDYGTVQYSNPVRQTLFTLEDCEEKSGGGKKKAVAAADALNRIAADVEARGIVLSIPMPGHAESPEAVDTTVSQLDSLIRDECDVVFLLTDTRESRWLPTVLAAAHNKLLINAALGLDTWLVMRHGNLEQGPENKESLGCYFCNDVVAPENSTQNRTLDQQCTVTRPGLAAIAGAMAVELAVGILHHPLGSWAPAPTRSDTVIPADPGGLGKILPHQIRGSLLNYGMVTPTVPSFGHCTGCAPAILNAYRQNRSDLMQKTCCQSSVASTQYLEQLAGLTEFRARALSVLEDEPDDDVWTD